VRQLFVTQWQMDWMLRELGPNATVEAVNAYATEMFGPVEFVVLEEPEDYEP